MNEVGTSNEEGVPELVSGLLPCPVGRDVNYSGFTRKVHLNILTHITCKDGF